MEINIRIKKPVILGLIAFAFTTGFTLYDDLFEYSKNLEIYGAAYKEVGKNFVDEVKPGDLMRKGLDAMLANLDPYTVYYSESQAEEALLDRQGEYNGVGCRVFVRNQYPVISEVFPGYAFANADVRPGDILKSIAGQSMFGKNNADVSVYLRGAPDTEIEFEVEREGKIIKKKAKRTEVVSKNVPYYGMLDAETGYIKLDQFGQKCATEIQNALLALNKDGKLKNVVLDLRDNGGGLLNEAVNIVGLFVGPGKLVVNMKGRTPESNRTWTTTGTGGNTFINTPLVILVNSHSASASEVVSGSIQDMDRGIIVGRNSYGKGLVQNYFQLPYRTQMKITTAKYYTPSGRCIQLLDYRHRNADGSAGKMPDSLRTAFKTSSGRTVYDGGGIRPDKEVDEFAGQSLLKLMMDERIVFDFANHYRNSHETIAAAKDFTLSKSEMDQFISEANTQLSKIVVEKLKRNFAASIAGDSALAQTVIDRAALYASLTTEIRQKLDQHRDVIEYKLKLEILKRYYSEAALYESSFVGDPDLDTALGLFKNMDTYRKILKP